MLRFFNKRIHNRKGFTLIELVVVIAIIGILALIAIPRFTGARTNAERRTVEGNLRTIDSAIMVYQAEKGDASVPTADNNETTGLVPKYLAAWPTGPAGATYEINGSRATVSGTVGGKTFTDVTVENLAWPTT